jgi:hypothetical protein
MASTSPAFEPASVLHQLPPLILHPCGDSPPPEDELAIDESDELTRRLMATRYVEFRMLCFIGKDINRWLEQCVEFSANQPELGALSEANLINLLLFHPPAGVVRKLSDWKVENYRVVFSRALGLSTVYMQPPSAGQLPLALLRDLSRYADALFECRIGLHRDRNVEMGNRGLHFKLYASGEYLRLFEKSWDDSEHS